MLSKINSTTKHSEKGEVERAEKIVVVVGVAAGAGAATKARRTSEAAEITMFERGSYVSFANCGLPYYVGGEITEREQLFLVTAEMFKQRFNINVKINHEVKLALGRFCTKLVGYEHDT